LPKYKTRLRLMRLKKFGAPVIVVGLAVPIHLHDDVGVAG
jgi:hypothetical protein